MMGGHSNQESASGYCKNKTIVNRLRTNKLDSNPFISFTIRKGKGLKEQLPFNE